MVKSKLVSFRIDDRLYEQIKNDPQPTSMIIRHAMKEFFQSKKQTNTLEQQVRELHEENEILKRDKEFYKGVCEYYLHISKDEEIKN